jgi:S-formylglutathione hydrolase FrmB
VDTYLSVDVVHWIRTHLQVDPNTAHWAVGGFSYGGSCSLELAVAHPRLFPTILDISGEVTPTLGNTARTVAHAFGGNLRAYLKVQPLRILAAGLRDPRTAANWTGVDATLAVGRQDVKYTAERATVARECRKAGIAVHELTIPGAHSWLVATAALIKALPHLAARMGLP